MSYVSLLYGAAFLIYFILASLVITRNPRSSLNWSAGLFLLALAVWSFEDVFHGNPSLPEASVDYYSDIGTVGRFFLPSLFLWFAIVFTRRMGGAGPGSRPVPINQMPARRIALHALSRVALFLFPVFLIFMLWTRHFTWYRVHYGFGWVVVWDSNLWSWLFYAYLIFTVGLGMILIFRFRRRTSNPRERHQGIVILGTSLTSLILGVLTDIVFPNYLHIAFPELAGFLCLIWAAGLAYGIIQLKFLVTPEAAAREILATIQDAVLLLSPGRTIIELNQAALDLTGYAREELIDRPAVQLFLEAARFSQIARQLEADDVPNPESGIRNTESAILELPLAPRDGGEIPVSISAGAIRDRAGRLTGSVWVLRDITLQKQAENVLRQSHAKLEQLVAERNQELKLRNAELQQSEQRYRLLAENTSDVIWTSDLDLRLTYISPSITPHSGFTPDQLVGQTSEQLLAPGSLAHAREVLGQTLLAVLQGGPHLPQSQTLILEYRRKDGSTYWSEDVLTLLRDKSGRPTGLLGVSRDVTERKRVEDELDRYRRHLEELVAQPGAQPENPQPQASKPKSQ